LTQLSSSSRRFGRGRFVAMGHLRYNGVQVWRQPDHAERQLAHRVGGLWPPEPPLTGSQVTGDQVAAWAQSLQSVFGSTLWRTAIVADAAYDGQFLPSRGATRRKGL
jgi:hypothetical protein